MEKSDLKSKYQQKFFQPSRVLGLTAMASRDVSGNESVSKRPQGERFLNRYLNEFNSPDKGQSFQEMMDRAPFQLELDRAVTRPEFESLVIYAGFESSDVADLRALRAARVSFSDNAQGNFANLKLEYKEHLSSFPYFEGFVINEQPFQDLERKYSSLPITKENIRKFRQELVSIMRRELALALNAWKTNRARKNGEKVSTRIGDFKEIGYKKRGDRLENSEFLSNQLQERQLAICGGNTIIIKEKDGVIESIDILHRRETKMLNEMRKVGLHRIVGMERFQRLGQRHRQIQAILDSYKGIPVSADILNNLNQKLTEAAKVLDADALTHLDDRLHWETVALAMGTKYFTFRDNNQIMLSEEGRSRLFGFGRRITSNLEDQPNLILKRDNFGNFIGYEAHNADWINENAPFNEWLSNRLSSYGSINGNKLTAEMADLIMERLITDFRVRRSGKSNKKRQRRA